jgi:hypothetical protein
VRAALLIAAFASASYAFPVPKPAKVQSVAGTTWFGEGVVADTRYTFNADGSMTYAYNKATHTAGSWKQDGDKIYWETNNKYCEFEGTLSGNDITGKAWNVANFQKNLKFSKVESP